MITFKFRALPFAFCTLITLLSAGSANLQANDDALRQIETAGLLERISALASDEFGGRAPMSEGERLTLNYLEKQFREMGLKPMFGDSYRQAVPLVPCQEGAQLRQAARPHGACQGRRERGDGGG